MPRRLRLLVVVTGFVLALPAGALRGAGRPSQDVIFLRSGTVARGVLQACVGDLCRLGGRSLRRDDIAWIGLGVGNVTAPAATQSAEDETHLGDGTVETGALVGISLGEVVTQRTTYQREQVVWIHLAPPPGAPQPGSFGAPDEEPAPPPKPTPPPPSTNPSGSGGAPPHSSPTSAPASSPGGAMKPCPASQPLGGLIEVDASWNDGGCRGSTRAVLRFPLVDLGPTAGGWPSRVWDGFTAPWIDYHISSGGCSGSPPNGEEVCHADPGAKSGRVSMGTSTPQGFRMGDGYLHFNPVTPEIAADVLPDEMGTAIQTPLVCVGPHSGGRRTWSVGAKGFDIRPDGALCPHNNGFVACEPPTECSAPADEATRRDCVRHADRHARFPWKGESSWQHPQAGDPFYSGLLSTKLQWQICCGCGAAAAPPEPDKDPCGDTAAADGLAQTNRDQRAARLAAARERSKAFGEELAEARSHYDDYVKTVQACAAQEQATRLLIVLLAPEAEGAHGAAEAWEWAEQYGLAPPNGMQMIAKVLEKLVNGEDPTSALGPEAWQTLLETMVAMDRVEAMLSPRDVEQMEKTMEECAGAGLVSAETKLSADHCVEHFKAAADMLPELHTLLNDVRQLDVDYPNLQYRAWAACVQRARCQGTSEGGCAGKKPAGDWPPVP